MTTISEGTMAGTAISADTLRNRLFPVVPLLWEQHYQGQCRVVPGCSPVCSLVLLGREQGATHRVAPPPDEGCSSCVYNPLRRSTP